MEAANLSLPHLVRPPKTTLRKPPMLVLLHGKASDENDLYKAAPLFDARFLITSPRGLFPLSSKSFAWFHIGSGLGESSINTVHLEYSRQLLIKFIQDAVKSYSVDPSQV